MMIDQHVRTFAQNVAYNLFISGIAKFGGNGANEPVDTPAKLAVKLGVSASRMSGFRVIGNDVMCSVNINYNRAIFGSSQSSLANVNIISFLSNNDYYNQMATWEFANSSLKNFVNNSTVISNVILQRVFENTTNLETWSWPKFQGVLQNYNFSNSGSTGVSSELIINCIGIQNNNFINSKFKRYIFPKLTYIGLNTSLTLGQNFYNCINAELISIKKCKVIYGNVYENFYNLKYGCKIEVNVDLLTINNGLPAGDLIYAKNIRGAIVDFYDDNDNYITTL